MQSAAGEDFGPVMAQGRFQVAPGTKPFVAIEGPQMATRGQFHDRLPDPIGSTDRQQSPRTQHGDHLGQRPCRIRRVFDAFRRNDDVELIVAEVIGQAERIGYFRMASGPCAGAGDETLANVASHDVGPSLDQSLAKESQAAAHVQYALADEVIIVQKRVNEDLHAAARVVIG